MKGEAQALGGAMRLAPLLAVGLALAVAFASPVAAFRPWSFALDMVQHVTLTMVVPPLVLIWWGRSPGAAKTRLPRNAAEKVPEIQTGSRDRAPRQVYWTPGALARLVRARVAFVLYTVVLYLSLAPSVYEAALRAEPLHAGLHLALLGTALLFWWPLLGPPASRLQPGWALAYLAAATIAQPKAIGGLLAVVGRPLYPYYTEVRLVGGLTPLDDQQIAAGILGLVSVLALGFALVAKFLTYLGREDMAQAEREANELSEWEALDGAVGARR